MNSFASFGTSCCFIALMLFSSGYVQAGDWVTSFEKAEEAAKEQGMPVLLHFYATWCGPCHNMERTILSSPEVKRLIGTRVIGVKVDNDQRKDLARRFSISALPTDIIMAPDGSVLHRSVGAPGKSSYLSALNQHGRSVRSGDAGHAVAEGKAVDRHDDTEQTIRSTVVHASSEATVSVSTDDGVGEEPFGAVGESISRAVSATPHTQSKILQRLDDKRLGLNGYSPVSLSRISQWHVGSEEFKYEYDGVCYLLSSQDEFDRFRSSPERYIPFLHGCDPVLFELEQRVQVGAIEFGATFEDRVYFFASRKNRDAFLSQPKRYSRNQKLTFFRASDGNQDG